MQFQNQNLQAGCRFLKRHLLVYSALLILNSSLLIPASGQQETNEALYQSLQKQAIEFERPYSMVKKVVKAVAPSVAHIEAKKTQATVSSSGGDNSRAASVIEEAGSGIVYRYKNRNFIITNFHVIEDSDVENIRVEANGHLFYPTHAEHDPSTDLSVLFTDKTDLLPCRVGQSHKVEIGDFVVAIGSPFGLSHSVSYGIVSAMGRRDLELGPQGVRFQDFFQTDAAINPGNSGGPLINLRGEVVGINTAIASNSGGNDGIGFSIPMDMVTRIANDLIDFGKVQRGFLGVSLDARYSPARGRIIGLDLPYGTRVSGITPNSPAEKSDIQIGDVILEYNGIRIVSDSHLVTEVSLSRIGDDVPVKLFRAGKIKNVSTRIQDRSSFDPRG